MYSFRASLFILLFFFTASASAQFSRRDQRRYSLAEKKYEQLKFDDAEKLLLPLSKRYPNSSAVWDLLSQVQIRNYYVRSQQDMIFSLAKPDSTYKPNSAERSRRDSLDRIFVRIMNDGRPSLRYFNRSVNTWREATLRCSDAELPSMLLRTCVLDPPSTDSSELPKAMLQFKLGEEALGKQNYADAIQFFSQTLKYDSLFFSARINLGNAYFYNKEFLLATGTFRECIRQRPYLQEPRKYLVDALFQLQEIDQAKHEAIEAIILYPDVSMFLKLQSIARANNHSFDRHWQERVVFPNTVGDQPLNEKGDRDWMEYINGFSIIEQYCNKDGIIIKKNNLTQSTYSEIFSWEYMLKKTSVDKFISARKMQEAGYLDCYVMLSEYHIDFNAQYQDFARKNKDKLRSYMEFLMSE